MNALIDSMSRGLQSMIDVKESIYILLVIINMK